MARGLDVLLGRDLKAVVTKSEGVGARSVFASQY